MRIDLVPPPIKPKLDVIIRLNWQEFLVFHALIGRAQLAGFSQVDIDTTHKLYQETTRTWQEGLK